MKGHQYYPNVPWILKDVISAQVCKCTLWRTEVTESSSVMWVSPRWMS